MRSMPVRFSPAFVAALVSLSLAAPGCGASDSPDFAEDPATDEDRLISTITATVAAHTDSAGNTFERWTLLSGSSTSQAYRPSFVTVADVNKDGRPDLVVSQFGNFNGTASPGQVRILYGTGDLSSWKSEVVLPTSDKVYFPNRTTIADVNGDGLLDVVVASGFLAQSKSGGITWYEQLAGGGWTKHVIVSGRPEFYHEVIVDDVDGDGAVDFLTVGETAKTTFGGADSATVYLYRGAPSSADRINKTPTALVNGGGSLPTYHDVDGDGRKDLVTAQYFVSGESFAWYRNPGGSGPWTKQVMDTTRGPSIDLIWVKDLYGAGKGAFVGANHTNTADKSSAPPSAVFRFDPSSSSATGWSSTPISTGIKSRKSGFFAKQGAPGILGSGDIDGDGRPDITVSGDGDSRVFWLKNMGQGNFTTITLAGSANGGSSAPFGQCGGMNVADLDGSGKASIVVTSYEGNTVTVFRKK